MASKSANSKEVARLATSLHESMYVIRYEPMCNKYALNIIAIANYKVEAARKYLSHNEYNYIAAEVIL